MQSEVWGRPRQYRQETYCMQFYWQSMFDINANVKYIQFSMLIRQLIWQQSPVPLSVATPWGDDGDRDVGPGVTGQWHGDM